MTPKRSKATMIKRKTYTARIFGFRNILERFNKKDGRKMLKGHVQLLLLLNFTGPSSLSHIAQALHRMMAAVSPRLKELTDWNLLRYERPRYYLTPEGLEYLLRIEKALAEWRHPDRWERIRRMNQNRYM